MIKRTLATEWKVTDATVTPNLDFATIETEQGSGQVNIAYGPSSNVVSGRPSKMTAAIAADLSVCLDEAAKLAGTPATTSGT